MSDQLYRVVSADGAWLGAYDDCGGAAVLTRDDRRDRLYGRSLMDRASAYQVMGDLLADAVHKDQGWRIVRVVKPKRPKTKHLGYAVIPKDSVKSLENACESSSSIHWPAVGMILVEVRGAADGSDLMSDPPPEVLWTSANSERPCETCETVRRRERPKED